MTDVDVRPPPRSALIALFVALTTGLAVLGLHPPTWPWWDVALALGIAGIVGLMLRAALAPSVYGRFGSVELPDGVTVEATPRREAGYRGTASESGSAQLTLTMRAPRHRHAILAGATCGLLLVWWAFLMHIAARPEVGATMALAFGLVPAIVWAVFAREGARAVLIEIDAERRVVRVDGGSATILPPGALVTARRVYEGKALRDELIIEHRDSARRILKHHLAEQAQTVAIAHVIAESVSGLRVAVLDES